jgi:hypothetical protein
MAAIYIAWTSVFQRDQTLTIRDGDEAAEIQV